MATVIWSKRALAQRIQLYKNGVLEFGTFTALKTAKKINSIADDLEKYPTMGFIELLLADKTNHLYRAWHINHRFKLIYWYDEKKDIVNIEDIWDTRRNPETLTRRIKRQ